jgi:hypothetical protein
VFVLFDGGKLCQNFEGQWISQEKTSGLRGTSAPSLNVGADYDAFVLAGSIVTVQHCVLSCGNSRSETVNHSPECQFSSDSITTKWFPTASKVRDVNEISFYGITQTPRHNQYGPKIHSAESCIPFSGSVPRHL